MTTYLLSPITGPKFPTPTTPLATPFDEDSVAVFKSPVFQPAASIQSTGFDNTSLNFIGPSGSILLHISLRSSLDDIVLNSLPQGGGWGAEEIIRPFRAWFSTGQPMIVVYNRGDGFRVTLGSEVYFYKKRINEDAVTFAYGISQGQNIPCFSNPLPMDVFKVGQILQIVGPVAA